MLLTPVRLTNVDKKHDECTLSDRTGHSICRLKSSTIREWQFIADAINAYGEQTITDKVAHALTGGGWVIEHASGDRWRTIDSMGGPEWTDDKNEALCFSLRKHADAFASDDPDDVRIKER